MMHSPPAPQQKLSQEARADVQGFITSAFGHLPCTAYLFLRFDDRPAAKKWLGLLRPRVTTATSWRVRADAPKQKPTQPLNVAFTAEGLRALGLPENCAETFPAEFLSGMASEETVRNLNDVGESAPARWELGGPNNGRIHALLILHTATETALRGECERVETGVKDFSGVSVTSRQIGIRPPTGKEPFGFHDGVSQPEIRGIKETGVNAGEFILGYINEYGFVTADPVLREADDPSGLLADSANPNLKGWRDFGFNGSFVVYRKLEQDVAGFWQFMQGESQRRLGKGDPLFMVRLAAKIVGRWPSGAPLALAPEQDNLRLKESNDFLYAKIDPAGLGCPFGAHIRRTNPRDQLPPAAPPESLHMTARHRLLRRGKPYGPPLFDLSVLDKLDDLQGLRTILDLKRDQQSRGLHFLAVNASIGSQFEFVQQVWANNPHFGGLTDNPDPLIGYDGQPGAAGSMLVPRPGLDRRTADLPRFVTVRGGAYFFMPSLRALAWLAA
jgi:Dyp-type peroxidase family